MAGQKITCREPGYPLMLGANRMLNGYNFAVEAPQDAEVSLLLYYKNAKTPTQEVAFDQTERAGRICSLFLPDFPASDYEYNFSINGQVVNDPCAYQLTGRENFGEAVSLDPHAVRCGFLTEKPYDWEGDVLPEIPYEEMILYKLHVRGYTKLCKNEVKKKGTFKGLSERIAYWKELGINAIELMPAYEFMEVPPLTGQEKMISDRHRGRINYWGYTTGCYFSPKSAYCAGKEPEKEFKDLIKALHKEGIECIMEIFFPRDIRPMVALHVLQFWRLYYHVDGFHLLGDGAPLELILRDGVLKDTKLMAPGFDIRSVYAGEVPEKRTLAEYNIDFLQDMRRFLKSDEELVQAVQYRISRNYNDHAVVNYMTSQDGFTLNDLVSYNYKHNEENGEDNQDGSSYNYSWNCGVEGPSRKLSIRQMRERQMKNALLMMLLSQGVPMIYGGDEFANSQNGNNNAYCQDNKVGWVDWNCKKKNQKLLTFVKEAIAFRKEHPILHMQGEFKEADYKAKGFPDVSFHGERAWYCNYENTSRLLGVMYCGGYAKKADGSEDDFIYVGYNFHWEDKEIALPNLPEGLVWKKAADTGCTSAVGFSCGETTAYRKSIEIGPRTIVVLIGRQEEKDNAADAPVAPLSDDHETQTHGDEVLL